MLFAPKSGGTAKKFRPNSKRCRDFFIGGVVLSRIAIYGGSFDPPHNGHKRLCENLFEAANVEKAIIIPAHSSPFKNGCEASDRDRLFMCRRAFFEKNFEISDFELNRGGKSYTFDTVFAFKNAHPNDEIFLFMGDDMFLSLDRWYKSKELLTLCTPVAACRTADRRFFSDMRDFAENTLRLSCDRYILSYSEPFEISSTKIRELIKENKDVKEFLSPEVYEYIKERNIYK